MDMTTIVVAASIPSAFTGFCFWLIEQNLKKRADNEKEEREERQRQLDEREQIREKNLLIIDMLTLIAVEVLVPLRLFAFLSVAVHRLPIWIFQKFRLEETIWHTTKPKKKRNGGSGKKPRKSSCGT